MDNITIMMRMLAVIINEQLTSKGLIWHELEQCIYILEDWNASNVLGKIYCVRLYELSGPTYKLMFVDNDRNVIDNYDIKFRYSELADPPFQLSND